MVHRKIIKIDQSLCNGCGNCMIACSEGAIMMVDGKARVVSERYCDGLGACIGECPVGALTIEERDAPAFDEEAARMHQSQVPSCQTRPRDDDTNGEEMMGTGPISPCGPALHESLHQGPGRHMGKLGASSQLSSWPIQMRLAHADAPYFNGARLLLAADCSAFATPSISQFIKGRVVLIGCPKLDQNRPFVEKLAEILRGHEIKEIAVLHMEVPCCSHLVRLVSQAIKESGKNIPIQKFLCMIDGSVTEE